MSKFLILFLLAYLGGLTASLFTGAHWAWYVYELVYFLNPGKRWWGASVPFSSYSFVSAIFLFVTFAVYYKSHRYYRSSITALPQFKWVILMLITYACVYFSAISQELHAEALIAFVKTFLILAVAYKVLDSRAKMDYAIYVLIIGITYLGLFAYQLGRDEFGRVGRIGMIDAPDVNVAAAAMIAALPFLIFYFWKGTLGTKVFMTCCGAISVNGLVLANSRGATVGAAIAVTYFVWEMFRSRFKIRFQRVTTVVLIVLGLIALAAVIDTSFIERMETLQEVENERRSGSNRFRLWLIAFEMLKDYPFGLGAYGYELLSPSYVPSEYFDFGKSVKAVHSIWFQALSEISYLGFFFFMMIILTTYRVLIRVKRHCLEIGEVYGYYFTHALLSAYVGVLAASSFINQFRTQIVYWLVMFSCCVLNIYGVYKPSQEENSQERKVASDGTLSRT